MSKVLFLVNHEMTIYNFRLEIVERFLKEGYEVHISSPCGEKIDELIEMGILHHDVEVNRHGMNPMEEMALLKYYKDLFKRVEPKIIFGFTIKPNLYGAMAARKAKIPFVANITGLGVGLENDNLRQKVLILLYKYAFRNIYKVFFQNEENRLFFVRHKIAIKAHDMLPGSGVNLEHFSYQQYPKDDVVKFLFISRIMKEKGIDHYLETAEIIKKENNNVEFHVCGFCEDEYDGKLQEFHNKGIVIYHGMISNVSEFIQHMNCIIHPTYYPEGLSNVLLEACATGRPIITTDRSGCREVVEDGYNGYMIPQKNLEALISAVRKFLELSNEEKEQMGKNARKKVEKEFDRNIVVQKYVDEVTKKKGV